MSKLNRLYVGAVVALGSLMVAVPAFATAPVFNPAADLGPSIDTYANTLFDGIVEMLPLLLAVAAVFTLLAIGVRAIFKYMGRSRAKGATG